MKPFVKLNICIVACSCSHGTNTNSKTKWAQDWAVSECLKDGNEPLNMLLAKACVDYFDAGKTKRCTTVKKRGGGLLSYYHHLC